MTEAKKTEQIVIKKYANRRLYDTSISKYITLDDLCQMVKDNVEFTVQDAKTNEDLTRSVLTQIIFEQEARGYNILPINFLRKIIGFYDDSLRSILPTYLESMMDNFSRNQDKMRSYMGKLEEFSPFKQFEQLGRQNMEIVEKMFSMFTQFNPMMPPENKKDEPGSGEKK